MSGVKERTDESASEKFGALVPLSKPDDKKSDGWATKFIGAFKMMDADNEDEAVSAFRAARSISRRIGTRFSTILERSAAPPESEELREINKKLGVQLKRVMRENAELNRLVDRYSFHIKLWRAARSAAFRPKKLIPGFAVAALYACAFEETLLTPSEILLGGGITTVIGALAVMVGTPNISQANFIRTFRFGLAGILSVGIGFAGNSIDINRYYAANPLNDMAKAGELGPKTGMAKPIGSNYVYMITVKGESYNLPVDITDPETSSVIHKNIKCVKYWQQDSYVKAKDADKIRVTIDQSRYPTRFVGDCETYRLMEQKLGS